MGFILAIIIIFPLIALIITYFICKKMKISNVKSVGFAADVATFLLFFSVPLAVNSIWDISIVLPLIMIAVFIAIAFTYMDWRTKKEIEVMQLLKKIWRVYFILLSAIYFFLWVAGLVLNIMEFVSV
ncbi:DUF3397 domain-containing protein [Solibacillus sp. CAU 1738]|uniref:DUF3397 domain-containing protein n=1 Tax=Solibacillus sp. CAU 1738 TaxID=3140363 RepID=UPI003260A5C6